jgi:hypothetical protein
MRALAKALVDYFQHLGRPRLEDKPLDPPEPAYGKSAPMTGLWAGMSDEQKASIRSYKGSQNVGRPESFKPL